MSNRLRKILGLSVKEKVQPEVDRFGSLTNPMTYMSNRELKRAFNKFRKQVIMYPSLYGSEFRKAATEMQRRGLL